MTNATNAMNKTKAIVLAMMTENTGRNMLDSGMIYGYNYDKAKNAHEQPRGWVDYGSPTINLFHHLSDNLVFNEDMQNDFNTWVAENDPNADTLWEDLLQSYCKERSIEVGDNGYTYNYDNLLSQNFVWYEIETEYDEMVIIRTHNGCDARNGFSSPYFFNFRNGNEMYDTDLLNINECYLYCEDSECDVSLDNSYGDYKWRDRDDEEFEVVEQDGKLLCPKCGKPLAVDK